MRLGRKKDNNSLTPQEELEQKVDALMDPRREPAPDLKPAKKTKVVVTDDSNEVKQVKENTVTVKPISSDTPEIDIFASAKTAPEIPGISPAKKKKIIPVSHTEEPIDPQIDSPDLSTAGDTPLLSDDSTPILTGLDSVSDKIDINQDDQDVQDDPNDEVVEIKSSSVGEREISQLSEVSESQDDDQGQLGDPYDNPQFDKAISDITKEDSDKLLGIAEAKNDAPKDVTTNKPDATKKKPKNSWLKRLFKSKKFRRSVFLFVLLAIVGLCVWPNSRYYALNTAGVRSHASIKVVDRSTTMPLKNVAVSLGDVSVKTNGDGIASFEKIKLGPQQLVIDRVAFKLVDQQVTIGWGSNPLPVTELEPVGAQYTFNITDYLSGKAVTDAEVVSEDASALVDDSGQAILTLDRPDSETVSVTIKSKSYRAEKMNFAASTKSAFDIALVPAQSVVYVSKQTGKYDVYKIDVDGKNKTTLLEGTGSERRDIAVSTSQDGAWAAVVSSRSGKRDESKNLLDTLTLVNVVSGETKAIDDAQNIRVLDWNNNNLVYVATYATQTAGSSDRQRIVAYNTEENARNVLVASDNFNGVATNNGTIYYATARSDPTQQPIFAKVKADGTAKHTILDNEAWTLVRTGVDTLHLETSDGWYEYKFGDNAARKGNAPVDAYVNRVYVVAPGGSKFAWIDSRDGKGVLLVRDTKGNDRTVITASGVSAPVRWLNKSTLAYRVQTVGETADYVVSIDGGDPKKLVDVTASTGSVINY